MEAQVRCRLQNNLSVGIPVIKGLLDLFSESPRLCQQVVLLHTLNLAPERDGGVVVSELHLHQGTAGSSSLCYVQRLSQERLCQRRCHFAVCVDAQRNECCQCCKRNRLSTLIAGVISSEGHVFGRVRPWSICKTRIVHFLCIGRCKQMASLLCRFAQAPARAVRNNVRAAVMSARAFSSGIGGCSKENCGCAAFHSSGTACCLCDHRCLFADV